MSKTFTFPLRATASLGILTILAASSLGVTFSVTDVDWYAPTAPGTGTDGGYMHFDSMHPLDVDYGLNRVINAPDGATQSLGAAPAAYGTWRWTVRLTLDPGDAPPAPSDAFDCLVQYKGTGNVGTDAYAGSGGHDSSATAYYNDPFFPITSTSSHNPNYMLIHDFHSVDSSGNGSHLFTISASGWGLVPGTTNVYEGHTLDTVNVQGGLTANGYSQKSGKVYAPIAFASASVLLTVNVRLVSVGGQRVQPDL